MKKILLNFIALLFCFSANVQCFADEADERTRHWMGRCELSTANVMDWGIEYGIDYYPIQYVGMGVSVYATGDFGGTSRSFIHNDFFYQTENLNNELSLRTSLQLQSPAIWRKSDGSLTLFVKEDCGLTLPIPANQNLEYTITPSSPGTYLVSEKYHAKNVGGKSCFVHFKTSLALETDRWQFWTGYTWSNFDAYSSARHITIDGITLSVPAKKPLHGFHIALAYKF